MDAHAKQIVAIVILLHGETSKSTKYNLHVADSSHKLNVFTSIMTFDIHLQINMKKMSCTRVKLCD